MFPELSRGIVCTEVGLGDLVYRVVIVFLGLLPFQFGRSQSVVGQSHEDAVEPHLVGVDGLVPPHPLLCSGLVFQLFEDGFQCFQVFLLRFQSIHSQNEPCRTHIVEIEVLVLVSCHVAVVVNHLCRILSQVFHDALVLVSQVCIEHSLHLYAHHVTPFGLGGEVEHVGLWHAGHLRVSQPFAIVLIRVFGEQQRPVHHHVVEFQPMTQSGAFQSLVLHPVKPTVFHVYVVDVVGVLQSVEQYAIFALLAVHLLHVHVAHGGVESPATHLFGLVVQVDAHHCLAAFTHLHFSHIDILYHATSAGVCLDA